MAWQIVLQRYHIMLRGAIYGLAAAAIWGGMYLVSDVVLQTVPPFTLLTIRLLIGLVVLALILRRTPHLSLPTGRERWQLMAVGVLGFGISVGRNSSAHQSNAVNGAHHQRSARLYPAVRRAILHERLSATRSPPSRWRPLACWSSSTRRADFSSDMSPKRRAGRAAITWGCSRCCCA
jgi:hypothetical protein